MKMVGRDGFEPPNPEGADLQSAVFSHFTISPSLSFKSKPYSTFKEKVVPAIGLEPTTP